VKSIRLECNQIDWGVLTGSIFAKSKLQHLSLDGGFLGRDACAHIKSLLLDKRCALRSLTLELSLYDDDLDGLDEIINGISNNQSITCLSLTLDASYVIDSLKKKHLDTIEKFQLKCSDGGVISIHALGQQMPNLKSLTICGPVFYPVAQGTKETGLISSLCELNINMAKVTSNDLRELSSFISGNSSSRALDLDGLSGQRVFPTLLLSFFNSIRKAKYFISSSPKPPVAICHGLVEQELAI
jgi:hypothetical protein